MDVALVADVEDEFVLGGIEHAMQRDGEFDDTEIWAEVTAGFGEAVDEVMTHFFREQRELLRAESLYILGGLDGREVGEIGGVRRV